MLAVIGLLLKLYAPYSATGEFLGVICADMQLDKLSTMIANNNRPVRKQYVIAVLDTAIYSNIGVLRKRLCLRLSGRAR